MPTKANKPIVVLFIPTSANQVPNVADVNNKGNPEKNPRGKKIIRFFLKQSFKVSINVLFFYIFKISFILILGLAPIIFIVSAAQ